MFTPNDKHDTWWDHMNCRNVDPSVFDARPNQIGRPPGSKRVPVDWSEARATCAPCTVKTQCLAYVLSMPRDYTVETDSAFVAGLTPRELDKVRTRYERSRR